jgi:DNA-binding MarR family transcriptional regulator
MSENETVIEFPKKGEEPEKSRAFEKLWGKAVQSHGYAAIPSIMIRAQHRLGITPTQFCILVQLLEYWRTPDRVPFPTKKQLADRIGLKPKAIQLNIAALEKAGFIHREQHKTAAGDWGANTYHLDGLVEKLKKLEPEFARERIAREDERRKVETPRGKRAAAQK